MESKVKAHAGRRAKGAAGEREAAHAIEKNCPGLRAERNARNGKACTDVLVWQPDMRDGGFLTSLARDGTQTHSPIQADYAKRHLLEVKRQESLDIGTKAMAKIREQSKADGAIGVLWRPNGRGWRLEAWWHPVGWATYSGDDVWRMLSLLVEQADAPAREG